MDRLKGAMLGAGRIQTMNRRSEHFVRNFWQTQWNLDRAYAFLIFTRYMPSYGGLMRKMWLLRTALIVTFLMGVVTAQSFERFDNKRVLGEHPQLLELSKTEDQWRHHAVPPKSVAVLPVFAVAIDQTLPKAEEISRFNRHLKLSQSRFFEMTGGFDTFEIKDGYVVINLRHPLSFYKAQSEDGAPEILAEILSALRVSRFSAPWVFAVCVVNNIDGYPSPGGRPINGGLNNGAGYLHFSSRSLTAADTNLQSTLEHELGHAFGLLHVDSYGESMQTSSSIMGYNPRHHYSLEGKPVLSGVLLNRDKYALSRNKRVFRKLTGAKIEPQPIATYEPMIIPGHPDARYKVETQSGETWGSRVQNIFVGRLTASIAPCCRYDGGSMWHSAKSHNREVAISVSLPVTIPIDHMLVYTQHSGAAHMARRVEVSFYNNTNLITKLAEDVWYPDKEISFQPIQANRIDITFYTDDSSQVVVRGLRFFFEGSEIPLGSQKYLH